MKKAIVLFLAMLIMCMPVLSIANTTSFSDLKTLQYDKDGKILKDKNGKYIYADHWAASEIMMLTQIGLIDGFPDGTFRPDDTITKGEYIKMIIILATNRSFMFDEAKLGEHWARPYVKVAEIQGVLEKNQYTDDELDQPINRIEMVSILSKIQIKMKNIAQNREGELNYIDIAYLTNDEKDMLLHAARYGLLEGMLDDLEFKPYKNLTRAEATVSIIRIY